jgi:hypothetical protein
VGAWQGDMPARDRGRWHVFDNCDRLGLAPPGGRPVWRQFDDALLRLAAGPGPTLPVASAGGHTRKETGAPSAPGRAG